MSYVTAAAARSAALALVLSLVISGAALAQTEPPLVGPARDIAREVLVYPAAFDPLLVWPLTPTVHAVVDLHQPDDVAGAIHAGLRNGDDSYGIVIGAPLVHSADSSSPVDLEGLRRHSTLGVDLTNIIWRPRAKPALENQLGPAGLVRLSEEARESIARTISTTDSVIVPWVLYVHAEYRFNRAEYRYADPATSGPRSETRLSDVASMMGGVQFLVRSGDPGYFVGVGYIYSAVFRDADPVGGVVVGGPAKVRANLLRLDVRRPLPARRLGVSASVAYDVGSQTTITEATTYRVFAFSDATRSPHLYGGVRAGYRTGTAGGAFASVFVGPIFGRP